MLNKSNLKILIITFVLLSIVKFFTAKVGYSGDPTVSLVIKSTPTIGNSFIMKGEEHDKNADNYSATWFTERKYKVITGDESGFTGEVLYDLIIISLWILGFGLLIHLIYWINELRVKMYKKY